MASINYSTFSVLFVAAAAALLLAGGADAQLGNINPWCNTADDKPLCTTMAKGATTQKLATSEAIKSALSATTKATPELEKLAAALSNLPQVTRDSVVATCRSKYGDAVDNLKEALTFLDADDMNSVIDRIESAETSFSDCTDAITEMGGTSPLTEANGRLFTYASNCMAVATQK